MASTARVTWTAENKDTLMSVIFETHPNLVIDTVAVSQAWPADKPRPTPRAITEQLAKMRKNGGGRGIVRTRGGKSANVTPRKPKDPVTPGSSSGKHVNGSGSKRKRETPVKEEPVKDEEQDGDADEDNEEDPSTTVLQAEVESLRHGSNLFGRTTNSNGVHGFQDINSAVPLANHNRSNSDNAVDMESPTKRLRVSDVARSRPQRTRKQTPYAIALDDDDDHDNENEDGITENHEDDEGTGSEWNDDELGFLL